MRKAQAWTAASLSLLFIVVYGFCNWLTSQRGDVGTLFFEWERHIPFVPLMIVPYMSIDLFFVGAPFLCTSDAERKTFQKRVAFAILAAGFFFVAWPLKFAFPRPTPDGWTGALFKFLHGFDQPYNLFPSLHIALRTLLADKYAHHTSGGLRRLIHVWFSLIGFSTVLTYQHHVMDVAGGFVLAAFSFYLFPEEKSQFVPSKNHRVGLYYAFGCLSVAVLAALSNVWGWLFLWPALALGLVTLGYFGKGSSIYGKQAGKLPLSARIVLAPCLFGQYLSWLYYKRRCAPWNAVEKNLWIGRHLDTQEAASATEQGIKAVLDMTAEFSSPFTGLNVRYLNIPLLDLSAPSAEVLEKAARFIEENVSRGIVYVYCKVGYSRSAMALGAYLIKAGLASSPEEAVAHIRKARPSLIVRQEAIMALEEYCRRERLR